MQNNLSAEGLYINDFHRENSMAAQRAVRQMSLHPYSREQKIAQIQMLRRLSASSKESANGRSSESHISSGYFFRGKCYVKGYSSSDNSDVLYQLGGGATGIREMSRTKAELSLKRVGSNLVIDSDSDEHQTIVMSTMDGRVVRSLTAKQGSNIISLNGLLGGVYIVTLYRQSTPMRSSKIIVK